MSIIRELARLGNKIDSASTGQFLSKGSTTGSFGTISYTDLTGRPTTLDSSAATSIVDSAYIQARQSAAGGGGLDSALTTQLIDSSYIAARAAAGSSGYQMYEYTATQGQTTFQDSDTNGNILSYSEGGALVFYNGVLLGASDVTATSGSSVVLTTGADSGSHVAIAKWSLAGGGGGSSATWYGARGLICGGTYPVQNTIDYITIQTTGNATDFGDMTTTREDPGCFSDGTKGFMACGYDGSSTPVTVDFVTIATTGNAADFGDMTVARQYGVGTACDATYGLLAGNGTSGNVIDYIAVASAGATASDFGDLSVAGRAAMGDNDATRACFGGRQGGSIVNTIDYVTMQTPGNATDFGDLTVARKHGSSVSDTTRICFAGGQGASYSNVIDYITTQTTGNATDFGDATQAFGSSTSGMSDASRGCYASMAGGSYSNVIEYITIQTPGNATDFGDRNQNYSNVGGCAGAAS